MAMWKVPQTTPDPRPAELLADPVSFFAKAKKAEREKIRRRTVSRVTRAVGRITSVR